MKDIEHKILERTYQTPGRARSAIARSTHMTRAERKRLGRLIDEWENAGTLDHVVAGHPSEPGEPSHPAVELVDAPREPTVERKPAPLLGRSVPRYPVEDEPPERAPVLASSARIGLNALVRVQLTLYGLAILHGSRGRVSVPETLLETRGVWTTTLWDLMVALGPSVNAGDEPIVGGTIEVLDARVAP
jgi:hypothetical protein